MFAVVITGAPGAGKTTYLIGLTDALVDVEVAHAAIDTDEVSWAYPFPDLSERAAYLGNAWAAYRDRGHAVLLLGEVIESKEHLTQLLEAVGAEDHLLVRLTAPYALLRQRILEREPPGWSGIDHLLEETERWVRVIGELADVHLTIDTTRIAPAQAAALIRAERPDKLGG